MEDLRARLGDTEQRLDGSLLSSIQRVVLESMSEGVAIIDDRGYILYTNPAEDRMFGYAPGELIGQHVAVQNAQPHEVHWPPDGEVFRSEAKPWEGEWLNRKKDGSLFYTRARTVALHDRGKTYRVCLKEDISERRRAELELRGASETLQALIHASPLPIVAFSRAGLIQLWNAAAERVFGWLQEEVLGHPLPFIPEDKRLEHQSMRERDLSGESFTGREVRRRKRDGSPIDISVSTAPMYDATGQITGIMSVYVDVTDQKRFAEQQHRAMEMLRENEAQLTLLVEASSLLLASPQSDKVLGTILELAQRFVRAEAYAVWSKQGGGWRLMVSTGLSDGYERVIAPARANDLHLPEQPFAVEDVFSQPELAARAELYRAEGIQSILTVPLRIHGEIAGTIVFYYRSPHVFAEAERRVAGALGNLAASAWSAAETYKRQAELTTIAEAAQRRATFLAAVGEEMASSLEYEVTLASVAEMAVPGFADWCAVDVLQPDGQVRRLAVKHVEPAKSEFAYEFARRYPPREDDLNRAAMRTGHPILLAEVPDALLVERAVDADHLDMIREIGVKSVICAPMMIAGRALGVITFVSSDESRRFADEDLTMATEIARRAAIAVDNARLFREVRESEERFRRLYELNILAVAFWNVQGYLTAANDAFLSFVGVSRADFDREGGLPWADFTPEEFRSTDQRIIEECRESGVSQVHEKDFLRRDGTRTSALVAAAFLNPLQTEGLAFIVDITERKKLVRQFQGVADAAVAITAANSVADVLRVTNDCIRALVSCADSELQLTSETSEFTAADLTVPLQDRSGKIMGTVRLWAKQLEGFTENDRATVLQLAKTASIAIENTDLNESLRLSNEELQRANEDLNQFAYSASHDLQEPLRMISIYTQLLSKKLGATIDNDTRDYMRFTLDGAQRMELLIKDLLAYTHAVNIRGVPEYPMDSGAALRKAIANLQGAIDSSGAQIRFGSMPPVRAYDIHLVQLFQNLVGNAIKYCGPESPKVQVSAHEDTSERFWVFTVEDGGLGIAPRYHNQVFGLFKRLYSAHQYPGTGIGLAICQKVVERYGGRIWVESEEGKGCRFIFTLPS